MIYFRYGSRAKLSVATGQSADYKAHEGQLVTVLMEVPGDLNPPLWHIQADDGWKAVAEEGDLTPVKEAANATA